MAAQQERVQNLETIVTNEAWIANHEDAAEGGELTPPPDLTSESESEAEYSAEIARRLRERGQQFTLASDVSEKFREAIVLCRTARLPWRVRIVLLHTLRVLAPAFC